MQYLVQDSHNSGYLHMQGSGSEYIPMIPSSPGRREAAAGAQPEKDSYGSAVRARSSDCVGCCDWKVKLETVEELGSGSISRPDYSRPSRTEKIRHPQGPHGSQGTQVPLQVSVDSEVSVTQAVVHPEPKESPSSSSHSLEDRASPDDPFLTRSDSDRSDKERAPGRPRRCYKCNDSVTSETSSGFHSDYQPEDSGTLEYSAVIPHSPEVMV